MACVITVAGSQAGAGKTTIAVNLAASFVLQGHSCLLIDLTATADASLALGVNLRSGSLSAGALLSGQAPLSSVRLPTASGIDLIAGHPDIALVAGRPEVVNKQLHDQLRDAARQYQYVLLDCPLRLGSLEAAALAIAEQVLIAYCPGQAFGQPVPALPRLQLAYVTGSIGIIANKVLPDWKPTPANGHVDQEFAVRLQGSIRYTPELDQMYWRGIPPVLQQPDAPFAQDIRSLAGSLNGS